MREKAKIAGAVVIILLLVTANIQAEVITINLTAQITQLDDMDNLLLGQLGVGSTISGSYTYDSDAADLNPSPHYGGSIFTTVPYGINLAGGGYVFKSDPENTYFVVGVRDDDNGDGYLIRSDNNLSLYQGVSIDTISWQLDDYSGMALSSDALPTTAPVLSDWPDTFDHLYIHGQSFGSSFFIRAPVTSAELVPEPATIALLALGGLFLRKRSK